MKLIYLLALLFVSCGGTTALDRTNQMKTDIAQIQTESKLSFPTGSKILYQGDDGGGREYREYIIYSPQPIDLAGDTWDGDAATMLEKMKELAGSHDFGKAAAEASIRSSWDNESGKWQADVVKTNTGNYLYLENFK